MVQKSGKQYVFPFGPDARGVDSAASMRAILGAKGAQLLQLAHAGFPIPPGFVISTEACAFFQKHEGQFPPGVIEQLQAILKKMESAQNRRLGHADKPLFFSVRCGAAIPVPGLMSAILNIGLNDTTIAGLVGMAQDEKSAWTCYLHTIEQYALRVLTDGDETIRQIFTAEDIKLREKYGASSDEE